MKQAPEKIPVAGSDQLAATLVRRRQSSGEEVLKCFVSTSDRKIAIINDAPYYGTGIDPDHIVSEHLRIGEIDFTIGFEGNDRVVVGLEDAAVPFAKLLQALARSPELTSGELSPEAGAAMEKALSALGLVGAFGIELEPETPKAPAP